ncbi:MAG: DnaB-like helicase C-terminal domain-containing protein, partial [Chloroflexota bacterium]|nr:DnaB-like helicase C-terminal domain-containing protein [Chloroflexota bacterium]
PGSVRGAHLAGDGPRVGVCGGDLGPAGRFCHHAGAGAGVVCELENYLPIPTGFTPFEEYLGSGLHGEDLWLVAGMQNTGKTVAVLQMARNVASSGRPLAIVVCYEHSPVYLFHRVLCLESIDLRRGTAEGGITRDAIDAAVVEGLQRGGWVSFDCLLDQVPGASGVWRKVQRYLEGVWLILGDGRKTTADVLELYVELAGAAVETSASLGAIIAATISLVEPGAVRVLSLLGDGMGRVPEPGKEGGVQTWKEA